MNEIGYELFKGSKQIFPEEELASVWTIQGMMLKGQGQQRSVYKKDRRKKEMDQAVMNCVIQSLTDIY